MRTYAFISKGKYKDKIALVTEGSLDEDHLQYPKGWYRPTEEFFLARDLVNAMYQGRLDDIMSLYVRMSDASRLISKYMVELQKREFQGGCCG